MKLVLAVSFLLMILSIPLLNDLGESLFDATGASGSKLLIPLIVWVPSWIVLLSITISENKIKN